MGDYNLSIFYAEADYAAHDQSDLLGVEFVHHYGIVCLPLAGDEDIKELAYRHARDKHAFLTDENHTWLVDAAKQPQWHSRVVVRKNEKSPPFAFKPWWVDDGPGALWFTLEFRAVTAGMLAAEIACDLAHEVNYLTRAASQTDSVRGRREARKLRSFAGSAAWRARYAAGRWNLNLQQERAMMGQRASTSPTKGG